MPRPTDSDPSVRAAPNLLLGQPALGLIVHSDQGSQYFATNFTALVARHEAVQRMSPRGSCYDNAQAESFWSRLKTELLDGDSFRNLSKARLEISQYLAGCNAEPSADTPRSVISPPTTSNTSFKLCPNSVWLS